MNGQCVFSVLSDTVMVISTVILISGLGASRISNNRNVIKAIIMIWVLSGIIFITYPLEVGFLSFWLYPIMFMLAYKIVFLKLNLSQVYIAVLSEFIVYLFASSSTFIIMGITNDPFKLSKKISLFIARVIFMIGAILEPVHIKVLQFL